MRKILLNDKKWGEDKLLLYGFSDKDGAFTLKKHLPSFPFVASYVLKDNILICCLIDETFHEEYELVDAPNGPEGYSRQVKEEYEAITNEILSSCTYKNKTQAERIVEYVTNHYGDQLEHLWPKFPTDSIIRRKENQKWYCLFMKVEAKKLGLKDEETFDVMDLRGTEETILSIDNHHFFPGYHMNKKHWFTLILDERMKDEDILPLIEKSHLLASNK